MKKRIFIIILLLISLFNLTACKEKENEKKKDKTKETTEEKLIVNGYDLSLTKSDEFENLEYRFPENTIVNSLGTYTMLIINKPDSEEILLKVGITKFGYSTPEDTVVGELKEKKNIDGLEWIVFDTDGNNTYALQDGHDTYTISFISNEDLTKFEEEFMNNVKVIE